MLSLEGEKKYREKRRSCRGRGRLWWYMGAVAAQAALKVYIGEIIDAASSEAAPYVK